MDKKNFPPARPSDKHPRVAVPGPLGARAFALTVEDDAMAGGTPALSRGMLVVFDPDLPITHQAIVLAHEAGSRPVIRKLLIDGPLRYLTAPDLPPRAIDPACIVAVACKAVLDL